MIWPVITPYGRDFVRSTGSLLSKRTHNALIIIWFILWYMQSFCCNFRFVVIKIWCCFFFCFFFFRADKTQRGLAWKELFQEYYSDLGRYIDYYSTLKKAWDGLKNYLNQKCPRMIASLKGLSKPLLIQSYLEKLWVFIFIIWLLSTESFVFLSLRRGSEGGRARHYWGPDWLQTP